MRFQPRGYLTLIKMVDTCNQTQGGIYLPRPRDNQEMPTRLGQVLVVGEKVTKVKPGERVVLKWSQHRRVRMGPIDCRIVHEKKILGVMDGR